MSGLLELAERCEAAAGPDLGIDRAIHDALGLTPKRHGFESFAFTASLDAAMLSVPEGAWWSVMRAPCAEGYDAEVANDDHRRAATPALAICAAALRARAAKRGDQ